MATHLKNPIIWLLLLGFANDIQMMSESGIADFIVAH